jgi:hypothetical protein
LWNKKRKKDHDSRVGLPEGEWLSSLGTAEGHYLRLKALASTFSLHSAPRRANGGRIGVLV